MLALVLPQSVFRNLAAAILLRAFHDVSDPEYTLSARRFWRSGLARRLCSGLQLDYDAVIAAVMISPSGGTT